MLFLKHGSESAMRISYGTLFIVSFFLNRVLNTFFCKSLLFPIVRVYSGVQQSYKTNFYAYSALLKLQMIKDSDNLFVPVARNAKFLFPNT